MGSYFLTVEPQVKPAAGKRLPMLLDANELEAAVVDGSCNCMIGFIM